MGQEACQAIPNTTQTPHSVTLSSQAPSLLRRTIATAQTPTTTATITMANLNVP